MAVKTRRGTKLTLLDSTFAIEETLDVMVKIVKAPMSVKRLNWQKMKFMAVVLRPFTHAARMLEGENYPTGDLVAGTICYLRKTLVKMQQHEDKSIPGASGAALANINQRWNFEPGANISGKE